MTAAIARGLIEYRCIGLDDCAAHGGTCPCPRRRVAVYTPPSQNATRRAPEAPPAASVNRHTRQTVESQAPCSAFLGVLAGQCEMERLLAEFEADPDVALFLGAGTDGGEPWHEGAFVSRSRCGE